MFPLTQRKVSGYSFGAKTFYNDKHLGVDYTAVKGTPVMAPFDGTVLVEMYGYDGGNTIYFKPDNLDVVIRFMHLSKYMVKLGHITQGTVIALSGNTGLLTTAPHLHIDISRHAVNIKDFSNFIDPEAFDWGGSSPAPVVLDVVAPPPVAAEYPKNVTATEKLNVRSLPDHIHGLIVGHVAKGETPTVTERVIGTDAAGDGSIGWYHLERGGYIYGKYTQ